MSRQVCHDLRWTALDCEIPPSSAIPISAGRYTTYGIHTQCRGMCVITCAELRWTAKSRHPRPLQPRQAVTRRPVWRRRRPTATARPGTRPGPRSGNPAGKIAARPTARQSRSCVLAPGRTAAPLPPMEERQSAPETWSQPGAPDPDQSVKRSAAMLSEIRIADSRTESFAICA